VTGIASRVGQKKNSGAPFEKEKGRLPPAWEEIQEKKLKEEGGKSSNMGGRKNIGKRKRQLSKVSSVSSVLSPLGGVTFQTKGMKGDSLTRGGDREKSCNPRGELRKRVEGGITRGRATYRRDGMKKI